MNTKFLVRFGNNIKYYRRQAKLTQEELAALLDVHQTYIGKLETGKCSPSFKMLYLLAKKLNVKMTQLVENVD